MMFSSGGRSFFFGQTSLVLAGGSQPSLSRLVILFSPIMAESSSGATRQILMVFFPGRDVLLWYEQIWSMQSEDSQARMYLIRIHQSNCERGRR